jgi:2-polyprenyl-3-methyl-5-hydroxy-6-metoxy-1,4-benzoquinol methylase
VDGDVTRNHYDRLAATYDDNWAYSPEFVKWMTGCIVRRLRIKSGDLVADIGCGTGLYSRGLAERAATVVCVEPSAAMLAQVPRGERLMSVQASVEDVVAGRTVVSHDGYDAMLLKEVLHHVADPGEVIAGLARLLRPGGRMLVVMLPAKISYPLFAAALKLFEELQPDPADIAEAMRRAGPRTRLSYESFPLSFPAERYLFMVRNRYMSLLSSFDDVELEAGVAEIRDAHPGERIEFTDTFAFVLGTKA